MKLGIAIEDTWSFFAEIYEELCQHHQTDVYEKQVSRAPLINSRFNDYRFNRDIRQFLRNHQVVFFEWATELLAYASHLPKSCGIVTRIHRYEMYNYVEMINWNAVDRIILVSQSKKHEFVGRFPELEAKIVVIPEAISLRKFQAVPKQFAGQIGTLGNLTPRKRVYDLILAFYELNKQSDGYHLHIGGEPRPRFMDYYASLKKLVQELHLEGKVTIYGKVTDPVEWFRGIDIFVSNSYSEGLQVSPMEAVASGCYALSHHWDGAQELLPGRYLFYSPKELIDQILDFTKLSQPERQSRLEDQLAFVKDRFDVDKIKVQIRHVVEEVGEFYRIQPGNAG